MASKKVDVREQISALTQELERHSDRGVALFATAALENALAATIQARLLELSSYRRENMFGRAGPFSSFTAKIELGFALGLYGKEGCRAIEMIRDVCNRFARVIEIHSFDDIEITELINKAVSQHLPKSLAPRELFTLLFIQSVDLLYIERAADIRLVSLCESHPRLFAQANSVAVQQVASSTKAIIREGLEFDAPRRRL